MVFSVSETAEVVYIFEREQIAREMLYCEFEAILDGFIPLVEIAGTRVRAAYLRINPWLRIEAAVFFTLDFDSEGYADKRWNVPLAQLAENGAPGPDLGAGAIRLACRSQCPVAWHQDKLWDPDMQAGSNHFHQLRKRVDANRLLLRKAPDPTAVIPDAPAAAPAPESAAGQRRLQEEMEQAFRSRVAQHLKEQRLQTHTFMGRQEELIRDMEHTHNQRLSAVQAEFEALQRQLADAKSLNQHLKQLIQEQAGKVIELRDHFESRLRDSHSLSSQQLDALREDYAVSLQAALHAQTAGLREELQHREIELLYRREQQATLQAEITQLREQNQVLTLTSGDQLLQKLQGAGITFVTYQPGVGHLSLAIQDIPRFLDDAEGYVAEAARVSKSHYQLWLAHYRQPVCQALNRGGLPCGNRVPRVDTPAEFHLGENDRCSAHQTNPLSAMAARR